MDEASSMWLLITEVNNNNTEVNSNNNTEVNNNNNNTEVNNNNNNSEVNAAFCL